MAGPLYILALLALVSLAAADHGEEWTYRGDGPSEWYEVSPRCRDGLKQSPINIPANPTVALPQQFAFTNFDTVIGDEKWEMINNGHSVQVNMPDEPKIETAHGGLLGIYLVKQFHFHWGSDSTQGSEHQVNGKKYPLEMHIVHYLEGVTDQFERSNGLAVIGVFFETSDHDNSKLNSVIDHLPEVTEEDNTVNIDPFALKDLLPDNTDVFYRYTGSLTTPHCNEVVAWTLFKDTVKISENQLQKFRNLKAHGGYPISNNYRPTQMLHGRVVNLYDNSGL